MTAPAPETALVRVGPGSLHMLRSSLEGLLGEQATHPLQEAGFACGSELYFAFGDWLNRRTGVGDPADLDAKFLGPMLSDFYGDMGWGKITLDRIGPAALVLDTTEWAESPRDADTPAPSCPFTIGIFAAFLGCLAGTQVAVMEVESPALGNSRYRFLAGSPETLEAVFEAMTSGRGYEAALQS